MNTFASPTNASKRPVSTVTLVTLRIMPFLLLCWLMAFIDRINIGFAQLQMKQDLGFGDAVYGFGAGIFFIGYVLFEVPSNIYLERIGARKTFSRIMICWGITSSLTMLIRSPEQFYVMRFLLGAFEAGFFPGLLYYLSRWFPETKRASIVSWFFVSAAFAGIIGGILSGALLHFLNSVYGLRGWQWMFLIEGIPSVLLGIVAIFYLDDYPERAKWLSSEQKAEINALLSAESPREPQKVGFRQVLADPYVYVLALTYFTLCGANFGLSFWLPTILKDFGVHDSLMIGAWSAVPYALGSIGIIAISRHSDQKRERRWHVLLCTLCGALSLWSLTLHAQTFWLVIGQLTCTIAFLYSAAPIFWAIPINRLDPKGLSAKIALISSLGQLGGFAAPYGLGVIKAATGSFDTGLAVLATMLAVGGFLVFAVVRKDSPQ